jgi:hypothetical protein
MQIGRKKLHADVKGSRGVKEGFLDGWTSWYRSKAQGLL